MLVRTLDRLEREVAEILRQAADADQREDRQYEHAGRDDHRKALRGASLPERQRN